MDIEYRYNDIDEQLMLEKNEPVRPKLKTETRNGLKSSTWLARVLVCGLVALFLLFTGLIYERQAQRRAGYDLGPGFASDGWHELDHSDFVGSSDLSKSHFVFSTRSEISTTKTTSSFPVSITTFSTVIASLKPTVPRSATNSEETAPATPGQVYDPQFSTTSNTASTPSLLSPDGRMSLAFAVPSLIIGVTAVWIAWRTLAWMKIQQEIAQRQITALMNVQINLQLLRS